MKLIPKYTHLYLIVAITSYLLSACSFSYQTISTHGTAQDVVDETQDASPKVDATANVSGLKPPLL